ncbi:protein THYLAKOID ASSEMBLY 8, chloroplastic-like [Tasmannia lanceolata]|uniref:protein THYLAKOID ASSEMBLY 8, chloroplastic-like n=1 Tax=Tasmannia lanceolata TaxID=3420 RepID=UPI004063DDE3
MGSLQFPLPKVGFVQNPRSQSLPIYTVGLVSSPKIFCGLRGGPRKPLWRGRVMSTEAIQAVQSLKLANSSSKLEEVFDSRISRLLKADLIATLVELQRQNEFQIALKVFEFVRKEVWYKPDLSLYCDMIFVLGKNKLIEIVEKLFFELKQEGLKPDTRAYTEMVGAFLQVGMVEKAMEMYRLMKESGCDPDKLTLTILIRNLEKAGEEELASAVKKDCAEYMDFPKRFLDEVSRKHPK